MGVVLVLIGVVLAYTAGRSGEVVPLILGVIGSTALFYMGIGLYSRGNTEEGVLRDADDYTKRSVMSRTAAVLSGVAALGSLAVFGFLTADGGSLALKIIFGIVFLYNLPVSVVLWRRSRRQERKETAA